LCISVVEARCWKRIRTGTALLQKSSEDTAMPPDVRKASGLPGRAFEKSWAFKRPAAAPLPPFASNTTPYSKLRRVTQQRRRYESGQIARRLRKIEELNRSCEGSFPSDSRKLGGLPVDETSTSVPGHVDG